MKKNEIIEAIVKAVQESPEGHLESCYKCVSAPMAEYAKVICFPDYFELDFAEYGNPRYRYESQTKEMLQNILDNLVEFKKAKEEMEAEQRVWWSCASYQPDLSWCINVTCFM